MLERFHVPDDIAVKVNHKEIFEVVENIFLKMGMSKEDAKVSADVLQLSWSAWLKYNCDDLQHFTSAR